jgi:hypothetical protein
LAGGDRPTTLPGLPGGGGGGISKGGGRPSTLPSRPGAGGGGIAGGDRPGTRPDPPGGGIGPDRPGGGNRPTRPGDITRPGQGGGGIQRPRPDRPDRPIIGGGGDGRPGRPGGGDNTIIGGGNTVIGGGNNIGNITGSGNWGINNRPGGDWWSQNHGWGDWNDHWHGHWHDHGIHHHHDWYHGAWNNNWGSNWYAPLAWGAVGWGLGSWYNSGYGYGGEYYNPYYDTGVASVPYDYSQPVVVTNYIVADDGSQAPAQPATAAATAATAAAPPPPPNEAALSQFDQGLADFKGGDYRQALNRFDASLKQLPGDPVVHEVRALAQFALGDYKSAAAGLNSLLASAPGMDWTTMSSLYGSADDYTQQLRRLESHCQSNTKDAAAHFVLAYHYLVTGSQEAAIDALKVAVREQPKDTTAKRMLDSLAPPTQSATAASLPPAAAPPAAAADAEGHTDLVGKWEAKGGDATIELTIGDDSQFTWKATQAGKPPLELKGELVTTSDMLVLDNQEQGSMVGRVKSAGPDKWQFALAGGPPNDPGLSFQRVQ